MSIMSTRQESRGKTNNRSDIFCLDKNGNLWNLRLPFFMRVKKME